jgi:pimeloyl-ACP methyl ester carboxylesterase
VGARLRRVRPRVPDADELARRRKNLDLEIVEGGGHFPWLDAPDRYRTLLARFVTSTVAA